MRPRRRHRAHRVPLERGSRFTVGRRKTAGIRASSTCELLFDGCRVLPANVLGEVGKGYKVAIETLNEGRIGIGAQMIGLAQGALDHAIAYTRERKQFGKPIAEFQAVQHQIARAATELEAARLLVYNAARLRDARQGFLTEAAMCKIFFEVADGRLARGQSVRRLRVRQDYPFEKLYRDAKIGQIYEGTSNLQLQTRQTLPDDGPFRTACLNDLAAPSALPVARRRRHRAGLR